MSEPHTPDTCMPGSDRSAADVHLAALLDALLSGWDLRSAVPRALDAAEREPLASGGWFAGDVVRGLMEVPGSFWARHPTLYTRYQSVLRANAEARRTLPIEQRMQFWAPLADLPRAAAADTAADDEEPPSGSQSSGSPPRGST